ncbi:MAG: 2-oxo acid dehydrogenase subunit E2 [Gemmatimonadetes bacterium]|nr:2-oxo acid dehydrogenase subunit E2 [Gemmatimonadota bacterium]HPF62274.1 dihydrolipoamide acetyltransferase family protein [Gemmatimonadales bacterium]
MPTKVVMEALSPTMEEGRLVEWKKAEGDAVATGDVLAEVETDKAVMELVARADGTLLKRVVGEGDTVPVAEVVGWIGEAGEEIPGGGAAAPAGDAKAEAPTPEAPKAEAPKPEAPKAEAPQAAPAAAPARAEGERIKASPVARRIADERGLDLGQIAGSGPEGRIIKRDVESAASAPAAAPALVASGFQDVALSQMRKAIARRLVQSIGPIPTFYLTAEVDMERAAEARAALLARDPDGKFSFNDIIIRATAAALRRHPFVNAWWMDDRIRQWHDVHIGVAVAIDEGLITPIVRHADRKGLREIATEVRELAGRARAKRLQPEEYTGATFTISNLGMFGIDDFTAIINPPEVGILAVGRIEPKPVVVDGAVVVRRRMRMTLSCDHRVIDGATGAQFLQTLVGMLENPLAMVL